MASSIAVTLHAPKVTQRAQKLLAPGQLQQLVQRRFARIDGYLNYYGRLKHHEGMLRDEVRCLGYRAALQAAESRLRGATVLDIGTGSGVLALWAAKLGARRVYAVEASPDIARVASRLARANGVNGIVEVLPKHIEEVTDEEIPPGSVDVLVSELFSHFLVGERGLEPVTEAKRRFLKPGGLVLPATGTLFLAPFADAALGAELRQRHSFWQQRDFHGLDLSAALPLAVEQQLRELVMDIVDPTTLIIPPSQAPGKVLRLAEEDNPKAWRQISFDLHFPKLEKDAIIDGLCGWFDLGFEGVDGDDTTFCTVLSTSPVAPPTCWAQCRIMLERPLPVKASHELSVAVHLKVSEARESYVLRLELQNHTTRQSCRAGPIALSDVYARHLAQGGPSPYGAPVATEEQDKAPTSPVQASESTERLW